MFGATFNLVTRGGLPKDFFHQILSFWRKGHNKRLRSQTINKNRNQPEPYWTKTSQNCYLKPGIV